VPQKDWCGSAHIRRLILVNLRTPCEILNDYLLPIAAEFWVWISSILFCLQHSEKLGDSLVDCIRRLGDLHVLDDYLIFLDPV